MSARCLDLICKLSRCAALVLVGGVCVGGGPWAAAGPPLCFGPTPYAVGVEPSCVVIGDLNGDGLRDLAVANHDFKLDNRISILINNGDGTFAPSVYYEAGDRPYWIALGDVDADGDVDLAVSNYFDTTVSVFLNNGDGTLAPQITCEIGNGPGFVVLADLNNDGPLDLAVTNINDYTVSILMNNGDGTFARQVVYPAGPGPYGVVAADFNNDGAPDLAISNHHASTVTILANNGDGTFAGKVSYAIDDGPVGNDAADLNGDGFIDLVCANTRVDATGTTISVMMNNGDGTFAAHVPYAVPGGPYTIKIVDFNGDGVGDLAVSCEAGYAAVFTNLGDGTLAPAGEFMVGARAVGLDVGDLDGNGTPEVAVTCYDADEVWVLFNQYVGITSQPVDAGVAVGDSATFTVTAGGPGPFTYQWRKDGIDLADGGSVSGATTDTLTISPVSARDAGSYDVIVGNDCGPLTSAAATLTIAAPTCPADFNRSGTVNGLDLAILLGAWTGPVISDRCPPTVPQDLNGDCRVNGIDLAILLGAWGPCP